MKAILTYLETGHVETIENVSNVSVIHKGTVVIEAERGFWKIRPEDLINIEIVQK